MGQSVGKLFFLTSQIPYPLNLIVNSPNIGNKTKCTNNKNILFKDTCIALFKLDKFSQVAKKFKKKIFSEN